MYEIHVPEKTVNLKEIALCSIIRNKERERNQNLRMETALINREKI